MAAAIQNTGKTSVAPGQPEVEESLWDVNFNKAEQRIHPRQNRIKTELKLQDKLKPWSKLGIFLGTRPPYRLTLF